MPSAASDNDKSSHVAVKPNKTTVDTRTTLQRWTDCVLPSDLRQRIWEMVVTFATERPGLFSFIVAQGLLTFLPIVLFATFCVSCVLFTIGAGICFSLFWIGIALIVFLPTLMVALFVAALIWAWCVVSFVVAKWLYAHVSS